MVAPQRLFGEKAVDWLLEATDGAYARGPRRICLRGGHEGGQAQGGTRAGRRVGAT